MKGHDIDNLWFFGIVVAVAIPLILVSVHYAKKRARELTELAQQIGFQFLGSKLNTPPSGPSTFLIHKRGAFTNVLTGSAGGFQISLFDYTYRLGKTTVAQTVAAFSQGARLPGFELRPENIIDKMKVALAHQHADFDSHPEFSKRYVLQSPDKKPVEKFWSRVS